MSKVFIFPILLGFGLSKHFKHMRAFEANRNYLHSQSILITIKNKTRRPVKPPFGSLASSCTLYPLVLLNVLSVAHLALNFASVLFSLFWSLLN